MLYIKRFAVKILIRFLDGIVFIKNWIKKALFYGFSNLFKGIGLIFRPLFLFLYRMYMIPRNALRRLGNKNRERKLSVYLSNNYMIHFVLIFMAIFTIVSNVRAAKASERSGEKTIIYNIIDKKDEFGGVMEEGVVVVSGFDKETKVTSYLGEQFGVKSLNAPENMPTGLAVLSPITQEGGAVIKPHIMEKADSATTASSVAAPVISRQRDEIETYIVQPGDTISGIADKFGISVSTILWENNLTSRSLIRPGNKLTILPVTGVSHTVKSGENLSYIAQKYGVESASILSANKLASVSTLKIGQKLMIPGGQQQYVAPARTTSSSSSAITKIIPSAPSYAASGDQMLWPNTCKRKTQYYNWSHLGLDIACHGGQNIVAADSGTVIYSGWSTGYGYNVLLDHGGGKKTRYAHFSKLYVEKGEKVVKGQVIGLEGSTGWSTGPHLHFEVIINGVKKNPLNYIR